MNERTAPAGIAPSRQWLQWLLFAELLLILLVSGGSFLISPGVGRAVIAGGLVYWLPRGVFTWPLLRKLGQENSERVVVRVLAGFIGKALTMGALIVFMTTSMPGLAIPVFFAAVAGFYLVGVVAMVSTIAVP